MARSRYTGPVRDEPLAVELYNTLYASGGRAMDGLGDEEGAAGWLAAVGERMPRSGGERGPTGEQLRALRELVRSGMAAVLGGRSPDRGVLEGLNAHSSLAPAAVHARWRRGGHPTRQVDFGSASQAAVVLAAIAADAIELFCGPTRAALRRCGAPGCVLVFVKDHPRREWCSTACGNRARQARHYQKHHPRDARA